MKNLPTFEEFVNESLNEALSLDVRDVPKIVKDFVSRTKHIKNLKEKDWLTASEIIIVTDKDFDIKGKSTTGNYMLLGLYKTYGPVYKVEWASVRPDMKYPANAGIYNKEIDKGTWEKLKNAHERQMIDPKRLSASDIKNTGDLLGTFITDEINSSLVPVKGQFDSMNAESIKMEIESAYKDSEVSIIRGDKVRVDFYFKRAGDGRNVAKTNLMFIIDPSNQSIEFKNPDVNGFSRANYRNLKDISSFFKNSIQTWKDEDKRKSDAMQQNAFSQDR
jgi:hypothetical protein